MPDCLFCRIVAGEVPSTQVYADDLVLVIRDIAPRAPTHVLAMPRQHIPSAAQLDEQHASLLGRLFAVAASVARGEGIVDTGYRLVINNGPDGGQTVDHLHIHMLGGRPMSWPPG